MTSRDDVTVAVVTLSVVGLCVGVLTTVIAARSVADPLRDLRDAIGRVGSGQLDVAVRVVEAQLPRVQLLVQEVDDDVHRAEARTEVPGPRALDGRERVRSTHVGDEREIAACTLELARRDQLQLSHG